VAHIPAALLAAAGKGPFGKRPGVAPGASEQDREAAHFHQVFDQFVATKQHCGESTAGLTLEKFSQTLRKNQDQIVARHGAKSVRFTVYVKDGKAALKATPVK
jgi:hypothetical protein